MPFTRREFLIATGLCACQSACALHSHSHATSARRDSLVGFSLLDVEETRVLRIGPVTGAPVLLLHELPGMTPDDIDLARKLATDGLNVYLPLLFGDIGQDSVPAGYSQSCRRDFVCTKKSRHSPVLERIDKISQWISTDTRRPLGIIGMCLTGIFPLALLRVGVDAAVLCQPTVPFAPLPPFFRPLFGQTEDLGLGEGDMKRAKSRDVPFLTTRYATDKLCPPGRIEKLVKEFGPRVASVEVVGRKGHSVLASSFDQDAYTDAVTYLRVRLGVLSGPQRMKVARFDGQPCVLTAEGKWQTV